MTVSRLCMFGLFVSMAVSRLCMFCLFVCMIISEMDMTELTRQRRYVQKHQKAQYKAYYFL